MVTTNPSLSGKKIKPIAKTLPYDTFIIFEVSMDDSF
jgi:hypothetical protein